jgi:hypothetical protein
MAALDQDMRRAVAWLRSPEAVRQRCHALLALAEQDRLPHFALDESRLDDVADLVAAVTRRNYPDLRIPWHSRWRHFEAGGIDRWSPLAASLPDPDARARAALALCTVSVLLDAGAGPNWAFREADTGRTFTRSEGLAVASVAAFRAGLFSSDPGQTLRVDAEGLSRITPERLAEAFQVSAGNPLLGLAGRAALLRQLGAALRAQPDRFGPNAQLGRLFDAWRGQSVTAREILVTLLQAFASIWPDRLTLGGAGLGDVWRHPMLTGNTPGADLVPFHKLSQWLSYSLAEALQRSGVAVQGLEALTGLAEYRNGGLFVDGGVLRLRDPALARTLLPPQHAAVVEWRALTVALLDRLAPLVRARLNCSEAMLPLACVLQGGTWEAGRTLAREKRADGGPPIHVLSDGSLF